MSRNNRPSHKKQKTLLNYFKVENNNETAVNQNKNEDISSSLEVLSLQNNNVEVLENVESSNPTATEIDKSITDDLKLCEEIFNDDEEDDNANNDILNGIKSCEEIFKSDGDNKLDMISEDDKNEHALLISDEGEEENIIGRKKKRSRKRLIIDSDEEDEENNNNHTEISIQEDDIQADLNFLDKSDILQSRTRGRRVSNYNQALKKLKDRKSKLSEYDVVESGPIEKYSIHINSNSNTCSEESSEERDDDEFVVDDDIIDGKKTTPQDSKLAMMEMPMEFSKGRLLSFGNQLRIYIQYLIELTLDPVFDITSNTQYSIAKNAVMKRIQGYKDSMLTSDVWLPDYKEALDKYPVWEQTRASGLYEYIEEVTCQACRSNKPATIEIKLSSADLSKSTVFSIGSECCRKGEMYHYFKHFSSYMFNSVKDYIKKVRNKLLSNDESLSESKAIFNRLLAEGYVKKLTRDVKQHFNHVVSLYNLKGHRTRVEDSSSDSD
ncbi:MAG: hypothetical protein EXX96DRAFT_549593 [Benjaminiella poitrasii]|nr:MAG: hypothetical protein EXX96DRAFT_549593 [Benjaminiella poitrasii]